MALDITTARLDVAKLYIAAFDRAPDVDGLNFWVNAYVSGKDTLSTMAQKFTNSTEYQGKYPSYLADAEYVEKIYVNVFDRGSDADGKAFWVNALTTGALTRGTLMKSMVDAATKNGGTDNANLTAQAQAGVDAAVVAANTMTLTSGNDNLTGMLFEAPQTYTPGGTDRINSLQDNDKLTGTSAADVLNVTIGQDSDLGDTNIMPILTGVDTINVSFDRTAYNLDMQDSKGTTTEVNVKRMEADAANAVNNMADLAAKYSVTSSETAAASLTFDLLDSAVSGTSDATILALNKANVDSLVLQASASNGVETINMQSNVSSNVIGLLTAEDLKTLNISGSQALRIGATSNITNGALIEGTRYTAGLANVAGSLTAIDASTMTGALTLVMGAELNAGLESSTGTLVSMAVTGGTAADKFVLAQGASIDAVTGNTDVISGGEGTDTLVLLGADVVGVVGQTVAAATTANVKSVEALEIRAGHDSVANNAAEAADAVTVDADAFDALATIYVRNEGSGDTDTTAAVVIGSKAEAMTVNLNDLTAAQAAAITVAHGTTGNNGLAQNILNVALKTATGTTDTLGITLVDGYNTDVRFNLDVQTAAGFENVTLTDSDTESNTVELSSVAVHTGTITLKGGVAGKFMNLDATINATDAQTNGATGVITAGSGFNENGAVAGERIVAATVDASTFVGDAIVRVSSNAASATGAQTITMGSGNDMVIFDDVTATSITYTSAGLSNSDTVNGGTGTDTLAIDGNTNIIIQKSEWDKVSNFETVQLMGAGTYYLELDNDLIDANGTDMLTIKNDDDSAVNTTTNVDSDIENTAAIINMIALNAQNHITYNGEEGTGATVDRFIMSDTVANGGHIIDGGEADLRNTAAGVASNDVLEIRNTATVDTADLANISNVGRIAFNNDQAVVQTLNLTLNDAAVDRMVDAGHTASTTQTETIIVTANDGAMVNSAGVVTATTVASQLTINAINLSSGASGLTVDGDAGVTNDTVSISARSAGAAHDIDLNAGTGDTLVVYGTATTSIVATNGAAGLNGTIVYTSGASSVTDIIQDIEVFNFSNITGLGVTFTGSALAETVTGTTTNDTIKGGAGIDT